MNEGEVIELLAAICFSTMATHYLAVWSCAEDPNTTGELWERYGRPGSEQCTTEAWISPGEFDCKVYDGWWGEGPTKPGEVWYKLTPAAAASGLPSPLRLR